MIDFVKVGERISKYRRDSGMSQEEMADKLYVTRQALSKWENGTSLPSVDMLCMLSKMFSVSIEEILGLFEELPKELDREDIFRGHDRSYIVNAIAKGDIKTHIPDVLYQMSPAERMLILKQIKDGKISAPKQELWAKLTPSEQKFLGGTDYDIQKSDNRRQGILSKGRFRRKKQ